MKLSKTQDTLFLIGGAMMGAAALYLLDPQSGARRRRALAQAARAAGNTLGEKWDDLASHAKDLTHRVTGETTGWHKSAADSAHALADQAREIAHDLAHRAQNEGSHLSDWAGKLWGRARDATGRFTHRVHDEVADRAHDWGDWLSKRASKTTRQARSWLGQEERHEGFGGVMLSSTAVTCWSVGMGMMYFLDPSRGHARRVYVRDKAGKFLRDTGRAMRHAGSDLAHYCRRFFYGSRAAAQDYFARGQRVDSEQLVARIRAEVGHLLPHANQVQLMADAEGIVTLTGTIWQDEVDALLTLIHRVPGVTHVVNRLDTGSGAEGRGAEDSKRWPSTIQQ